MVTISRINLLNLNSNKKANNNNSQGRFVSKPVATPKYQYNLKADTVSFKGSRNIGDIVKIIEKSNIVNNKPRFNETNVLAIAESVTEKNKELLTDVLELGNKRLNALDVVSLLKHISKDGIDVGEMAEKIGNFNNLKEIVNGFGFQKSIIADHLDKISSKNTLKLLKSDLLLSTPKNGLNSFPEAYNYAVKYHQHQHLKKLAPPVTEFSKNLATKKFMNDPVADFSSVLLLGHVFDASTCNELLYNRGKYINYLYIPRLTSLNETDLSLLRKVQTSAVTDKDNKGSDLATYAISLDDKINTLNLLAANRAIIDAGCEGINFKDYMTPVNIYNKTGNFKIDFQNMKIDLTEKALKYVGVNPDKVDKYIRDYRRTLKNDELHLTRDKFWDINFAHLLVAPEGSLLRDIVVNGSNGTFDKMLFKEGPLAEINAKNRELFEKAGLNYDRWLDPDIEVKPKTFMNKLGNKPKDFIVKNWNRNPQESLFDGNYTTCCTGVDKDHGDSFLKFLTNTAMTTLEVRTADKNKVVAMSRLLAAKLDGKLSLVVENIEVNNKMAKHYLYDDKAKQTFREMIFDYARKFAKQINNQEYVTVNVVGPNGEKVSKKVRPEIPVYFSAKYYKVKDIEKGLDRVEKYVDPEMIGVYPNNIYINSFGDKWDQFKIRDDGDEFNLVLTDISKKPKLVIDKKANIESDSNYNHADTADYNQ